MVQNKVTVCEVRVNSNKIRNARAAQQTEYKS